MSAEELTSALVNLASLSTKEQRVVHSGGELKDALLESFGQENASWLHEDVFTHCGVKVLDNWKAALTMSVETTRIEVVSYQCRRGNVKVFR